MRINKKFRRVLGLALSAMLALGSITTSATTNKNEGTVLPDPAVKGSITIHKYAMESLPSPGTPASGLENEDQVPEGAKPLEGVSFEIEKVADDTLPEKIVGTNTDAVVRDNSFEAKTIVTANGENGTTKGVASISKLPQGIYLVTELDNAGVLEKGNPFLVSIPMAHPTIANSWLYDVHVYPKNVVAGGPSIDKDVTSEGNKHETAGIGNDVKWIIKPSIPADIADAKKYDIIDELDKRLNYTGNLEVYYLNGREKVTIDSKYYNIVSEPSVKDNADASKGGGTIKISFTEEGRKYLATQFEAGVISIRISFTTVINTSAALATEIPNDVTLDYTNSFGTNTEYKPNEKPEVHTGGVLLEKVDASDNNVKLKGAKFKIYPSLEDAKNGTNAIVNPADKTQEWEVTTGEDGRAIFAGLSYGTTGNNVTTGSTDYWIVETVAPTYTVTDNNGETIEKQYNLLREPLKVTVNATSHLESNKVTVENRKFTLPVTGGMGTVIFTLGGLAIMGAAALLYMRTTKRA